MRVFDGYGLSERGIILVGYGLVSGSINLAPALTPDNWTAVRSTLSVGLNIAWGGTEPDARAIATIPVESGKSYIITMTYTGGTASARPVFTDAYDRNEVADNAGPGITRTETYDFVAATNLLYVHLFVVDPTIVGDDATFSEFSLFEVSDIIAPTLTDTGFVSDQITLTVDEGATVYYLVDDNTTRTATQVVAGGGLVSASFVVTIGANSEAIDVSGVAAGDHYMHLVAVDAAGNQSAVTSALYTFTGTAPSQFAVGDWSVADDTTGGDATITITALPAAGSDTITDVEYQVDGGVWTSGSLATVGAIAITGLTDGVAASIAIRAVSAAGNGAASATKSVTTTNVGAVTRRKLVSTSQAAATGMHSTADIAMATDSVTVSFWFKATNETTNVGNTLWASNTGKYQIYTDGGSGHNDRLNARMDGITECGPTTDTYLNTWVFYTVYFGLNHDGTNDVRIFKYGVLDVAATASGADSEITVAATHYLMGDDAAGAPTDDGFEGELFDVCVFDGIVAQADLQYNAGDWADLSATGIAALKYRIDGQNASDPGEDSSGNGHNFTVEGGGVTLTDIDLPTGANV